MRCPRCQFDNPDSMRFCGQCGAELGLLCSRCGAENPPAFKFCGQCGASLTAAQPASFAAVAEKDLVYRTQEVKLQSYTPRHLAEKILTSRSALEGERKQVTVLFADVVGFSTLAGQLDPESIHAIMDGCFDILTRQVHRYEGTINQFTGDGIMALFGAPITHEDHALRALHAALGVQAAVQGYGEDVQRRWGVPLQMRLGLNTGLVVVGRIGDNLRMDYTARGIPPIWRRGCSRWPQQALSGRVRRPIWQPGSPSRGGHWGHCQ